MKQNKVLAIAFAVLAVMLYTMAVVDFTIEKTGNGISNVLMAVSDTLFAYVMLRMERQREALSKISAVLLKAFKMLEDGVPATLTITKNDDDDKNDVDYDELERRPFLMCWHDAKYKPKTGMYLVHSMWDGKPFCFTASYDEEKDEWRQWDDIQVVGEPLDEVQRGNITHWMPIQEPETKAEA